MDVIACGNPVMDIIVNIDRRPGKNEGMDVRDLSWQYGGKVATGIVAAARLSERPCAMMGTIGAQSGQFIKRDFMRHNVDVSHLYDDPTGQSQLCLVIAIAEDESRNFYNKRGKLDRLAPEQVDEHFISQAQYLLLSDSMPYSLLAGRMARHHDVKVVYDADKYYPEGMPEIMREVDYLIPSEYTYKTMFPNGGDLVENLMRMRDLAAPDATVIVTFGERGLSGYDKDGFFSLPAFSVDVVDTTGAGDVFHGAFIAGLLRGMDTRESARYASAASAIKCTRIGGRAGIPTHDVVMKFMETGEIDYAEIDQRVAYYNRMPVL